MKIDNPPICATCHLGGAGCCRIEPGFEGLMFGLLPQEVERISLDTGMTSAQFTVIDKPRCDFIRELATWFPPQAEILRDGIRQRLMTRNGACVFLTDRGCLLRPEARPYYCRMYPFWFDRHGNLRLTRSEGCLAQQDALSVFGVMRKLDVGMADLEELWSQYTQMIRPRKSA